MIQDDNTPRGELKRADHLIYVTLKYTRTVDVIKNIIKRLISAIEMSIDLALENSKVKQIPKTQQEKADLLAEIFKKSTDMKDFIEFYRLLKRVDKTENYEKKEEYRKNVTLITKFIEIDIPTIHEFYEKTIAFVMFIEAYIGGEVKP